MTVTANHPEINSSAMAQLKVVIVGAGIGGLVYFLLPSSTHLHAQEFWN